MVLTWKASIDSGERVGMGKRIREEGAPPMISKYQPGHHLPKGAKVRIEGLGELMPLPQSIISLRPDGIREHAIELWHLAAQAEALIRVFDALTTCLELRVNVDEAGEKRVAQLDPALGHLRL